MNTLLTNALDSSKLTGEQKQYLWYRAQGGTDDFTTWDGGNRAASKSEVNIQTEGPKSANYSTP